MLPREDPRDALFAARRASIAELPRGRRRRHRVAAAPGAAAGARPDLKVVPLRGNVETRLRKLAAGEVDATLLALAGLKRLGLLDKASGDHRQRRDAAGGRHRAPSASRSAPTMLACARCWRRSTTAATTLCVTAERACLAELDGSCHTPIAAYAELASRWPRPCACAR